MTDDELKRLLNENAAETRRQFAENRHHFNEAADRVSAETRHFFELSTEGLRHEIQLVAEGVSDTREALSRETADFRDEMRRGFAETQAMISSLTRNWIAGCARSRRRNASSTRL